MLEIGASEEDECPEDEVNLANSKIYDWMMNQKEDDPFEAIKKTSNPFKKILKGFNFMIRGKAS